MIGLVSIEFSFMRLILSRQLGWMVAESVDDVKDSAYRLELADALGVKRPAADRLRSIAVEARPSSSIPPNRVR